MGHTVPMSIPVARLNHAVLFVRDAASAAEFYGRVFGFEVVANEMDGKAVFIRAAGALGGASDHGVSKSLYGSDPDGNEFEIMWRVPLEAWGDYEEHGAIMPLDIDAELRRWGTARA